MAEEQIQEKMETRRLGRNRSWIRLVRRRKRFKADFKHCIRRERKEKRYAFRGFSSAKMNILSQIMSA